MNKSICFVGLDNYPVVNPRLQNAYIGGESVQQTLLARAFNDLGHSVSMVVQDHGQPDGEVSHDIRIWKTFQHNEGMKVFRFLHPRMTSIMRALQKANADIYYQSCAGTMTGLVAWFCRRHDRQFIFRTAHDTDCIRNHQLIKFWRDKKIYEYGLKRADIISVQGFKQQQLLKDNYGLASTPINMTVEIPEPQPSLDKEIDILWINNMRPFKRPELAIALARKMPHYQFVMIGGPCAGYMPYYRKISADTRETPNLQFMGAVPYHEVNDYMMKARIFINTSESEGFPNSFLQAWIRGVPVISFFDPDDLIKTHHLGRVPADLTEMQQSIEDVLQNDDQLKAMGQNAKHFVIENYAPRKVAADYLKLL